MSTPTDKGSAPPKKAARRAAEYVRAAPAFQLYAGDDIAARWYVHMTLAERGLYDAMRRVIWCDGSVATATDDLALEVRRPAKDVEEALASGVVVNRFQPYPGAPGRVYCEELAGQRARYEAKRQKQREGGKLGAQRSKLVARATIADTEPGAEIRALETPR